MATPAREINRPAVQPSVNYFDNRIVGKTTKRWMFYPGDVIEAQRKQEIEWLAGGGEETNSPCLQKYGRGFLPRGFATLLEMGAILMPEEHLRNVGADKWTGMSLDGKLIESRLSFVPVYPGEALVNLKMRAAIDQGIKRGMDELTPLIGKEWEECHNPEGTGILDIFESAAFGDGMEPTLRGLKAQIQSVKVDLPGDVDREKLKEEMLIQCRDFDLWGQRKLNHEHTLLKQGIHASGHAYTYSPLAELLLVQLEVTRQDQPFGELARLVGEMGEKVMPQSFQPQGMSAQDMELFERRMDERLALATQAAANRIAELEAKLAVKAEEATMWICDHCNAEMKLSAKGFHIGRHCPVLHPKGETQSEE